MRLRAILLGFFGAALLTLSGLLLLGSWVAYRTAQGTSPEPQIISLRDLSAAGYGDNRHVKVTGCALARRYGRGGSFWKAHPRLPYEPITDYEVWNEPNFGRLWCPKPDPGAYARLYLAARSAVQAVDPKALVLVGGLAAFVTDDAGPPAKMSF